MKEIKGAVFRWSCDGTGTQHLFLPSSSLHSMIYLVAVRPETQSLRPINFLMCVCHPHLPPTLHRRHLPLLPLMFSLSDLTIPKWRRLGLRLRSWRDREITVRTHFNLSYTNECERLWSFFIFRQKRRGGEKIPQERPRSDPWLLGLLFLFFSSSGAAVLIMMMIRFDPGGSCFAI